MQMKGAERPSSTSRRPSSMPDMPPRLTSSTRQSNRGCFVSARKASADAYVMDCMPAARSSLAASDRNSRRHPRRPRIRVQYSFCADQHSRFAESQPLLPFGEVRL